MSLGIPPMLFGSAPNDIGGTPSVSGCIQCPENATAFDMNEGTVEEPWGQ